MSAQPNFLILFTDQQRFDTINAAGYTHMKTPNLDRLVREGCIFRNAYTPNPVCVPARHSLLTGTVSRHHGFYSNGGESILDDGLPTLPRIMSDNGYFTAAVGKMHFKPARRHHGFLEMHLMEEIPGHLNDDAYAQYLKDNDRGGVRAVHGIRVRVAGAKRSFDPRQSYSLHWVVTPADRGDEREPNGKQTTANFIAPGVSARGYIYPRGDVDFYRFRLPGFLGTTQKVKISVQGVPRVRLHLTLMDDQKNVLAQSSMPTTEGRRQITTTLHCAKYYYVRIRDQKGRHANATDNYELTLARTRR